MLTPGSTALSPLMPRKKAKGTSQVVSSRKAAMYSTAAGAGGRAGLVIRGSKRVQRGRRDVQEAGALVKQRPPARCHVWTTNDVGRTTTAGTARQVLRGLPDNAPRLEGMPDIPPTPAAASPVQLALEQATSWLASALTGSCPGPRLAPTGVQGAHKVAHPQDRAGQPQRDAGQPVGRGELDVGVGLEQAQVGRVRRHAAGQAHARQPVPQQQRVQQQLGLRGRAGGRARALSVKRMQQGAALEVRPNTRQQGHVSVLPGPRRSVVDERGWGEASLQLHPP